MLSKSRLSTLRALRQKKGRSSHSLFVAEGSKLVLELLASSFRVQSLYAQESWLGENETEAAKAKEALPVDEDTLSRISSLVTPQQVLAVVEIPAFKLETERLADSFTLVLDGIRDPGNLGTIIRVADWFGIENIICSPDSADHWNPKVVQASMGSITRVKLHERQLEEVFQSCRQLAVAESEPFPVYGTFLEGKNIYETPLSENGILVIGNEGAGIRPETAAFITEKITIPSYTAGRENAGTAESLNAAVATAIACSEFRRRASVSGQQRH